MSLDRTAFPRLECIDLIAEGATIRARCTICGGQLARDTTLLKPWNLWDLWDALGDHLRVNHPDEPERQTAG